MDVRIRPRQRLADVCSLRRILRARTPRCRHRRRHQRRGLDMVVPAHRPLRTPTRRTSGHRLHLGRHRSNVHYRSTRERSSRFALLEDFRAGMGSGLACGPLCTLRGGNRQRHRHRSPPRACTTPGAHRNRRPAPRCFHRLGISDQRRLSVLDCRRNTGFGAHQTDGLLGSIATRTYSDIVSHPCSPPFSAPA